MHTPVNQEEFLDLLDQAIFETRDMLSMIESEGEDFELGENAGVFEVLERMLVALHTEICAGHHAFGGSALAYTDLLARFRSRIPFADVLEMLNTVQKDGFA
ncbi:hypothetical protein C4901_08420 [Acidiferrobacter sp. SPIII_3]|jgi:hypothetical protein|uniref:hypothetical protein n=1 Tax=Acidiferrobacter sp. SPIII_3 TaxID=1281578 RepID=UPI000D73054A|nr:hypothetical protein [Acidiferrobacter sp. SPIII_3]AWP23355.1 hypothetical protein C4901_08420 [Acidiferrobacter sp. SPIII_3]